VNERVTKDLRTRCGVSLTVRASTGPDVRRCEDLLSALSSSKRDDSSTRARVCRGAPATSKLKYRCVFLLSNRTTVRSPIRTFIKYLKSNKAPTASRDLAHPAARLCHNDPKCHVRLFVVVHFWCSFGVLREPPSRSRHTQLALFSEALSTQSHPQDRSTVKWACRLRESRAITFFLF